MPFASPVDREGIDGSGVRVALRGEVALDLVMIRGGEQVHRGFELQLLRGLVEDDWIQHDVVQVMRDIAGEGFQVRLRVCIMLLQGDGFNTFAILSEQCLAGVGVRPKASGWAVWACVWWARLGGSRVQYAMHFVRR